VNAILDRLHAIRRRIAESDALRLIRRCFADNFHAHWRRYAIAIALLVVVSGTTAASAWLMKHVVDEIFIRRDVAMLLPLSLAIILLSTTKGFATYGQEVMMGRIGNRIVAEYQSRVYSRLLRFGAGYFTTTPSSTLIMIVVSGAAAVREILNTVILGFARDLLTLAGLVAVMVLQAPFLSLITFIVAPVAIIGVTRLVRRVRQIVTTEFQLATRVIQLIQETVQGARVLKAFNLDRYMQNRIDQAVTGVESRANKIVRLQARTGPLMEALGGVAVGLVTAYAGWSTIAGGQSPGDFVAFVTAFLLAYEPAKRLARFNVALETNMIGLRMIYGVLDTPATPTEDPARALEFRAGTIEFNKVTFAYRPKEMVLNGITFRVERDTKVALVGPSGGGKTTILTLIPRLYDVAGGEILIDGQDLRAVSASSVREHIAFVSQDAWLFGGTIRENIRLGRLDADDAAVEGAARDAFAHDFIMALPKGYDTDVGENGVQLSGGQRQRVAIARAILKNAPIILLDEATSALDSESEKQVQLAFDRLMQGRTILVIAHRLSTILNADRILVIDKGAIVEEGTHRELLAKGGLYESLYRHQFADHATADRPRLVRISGT